MANTLESISLFSASKGVGVRAWYGKRRRRASTTFSGSGPATGRRPMVRQPTSGPGATHEARPPHPPLPPSTNHLYATGKDGKRHKTKAARDYEEDVLKTVLAASGDRSRPVEDRVKLHREFVAPIALEAWVYFAQKRKRQDLSNRLKLLEDTLAKAFGFDDSLITELVLHKRFDASNPRCEVVLVDDVRKVPTLIEEAG